MPSRVAQPDQRGEYACCAAPGQPAHAQRSATELWNRRGLTPRNRTRRGWLGSSRPLAGAAPRRDAGAQRPGACLSSSGCDPGMCWCGWTPSRPGDGRTRCTQEPPGSVDLRVLWEPQNSHTAPQIAWACSLGSVIGSTPVAEWQRVGVRRCAPLDESSTNPPDYQGTPGIGLGESRIEVRPAPTYRTEWKGDGPAITACALRDRALHCACIYSIELQIIKINYFSNTINVDAIARSSAENGEVALFVTVPETPTHQKRLIQFFFS